MDEQTSEWMTALYNRYSAPLQITALAFILMFLLVILVFVALPFSLLSLFYLEPAPCIISVFVLIFPAYFLYKLVAGLRLEVKLDKITFALGEPITGSVIINKEMKKQARSLKVYFYGLERLGRRNVRVCEKITILSGARTFRKGETIPFSISMPPSVKDYFGATRPRMEDRYANVMLGLSSSVQVWHVEAKLDLPGELDMSNFVMLRVTDKASSQNPS